MKINKLGLLIFPMILLSCMALGNDNWERFGDEPTSYAPHEIIDSIGLFTNQSSLVSCAISHGIQAGTEPLIYDFDGDGDQELFFPSIDDDYIRIYDSDCFLEEERNLGTPDGQACMFDGAFATDWGSGVSIFLKIDNNLTVMKYNGSFLNITKTFPINWTKPDGNLTNVTKPYLTCSSLNYGRDLVYYIDDYNVVMRVDNESYWNNTYNVTMTYPSDAYGDNNIDDYYDNVSSASAGEGYHTPVYLVNLDRYGTFYNMIWRYKDFVYQYDATGSNWANNLSGSCVYTYGTHIPYLVIEQETLGSDYSIFTASDGLHGSGAVSASAPMFGCLRKILSDGSTDWTQNTFGYYSIFVFGVGGRCEGTVGQLNAFGITSTSSGSGNRIWTIGGGKSSCETCCGNPDCYVADTAVAYYEFDFDGNIDYNGRSDACGGVSTVDLVDHYGGYSVWNLFDPSIDGKLIAGDLYNDTFDGNEDSAIITLPQSNSIIADIDDDGADEIINFGTAAVLIYKADFDNQPPNLYNNISYGGYYGYMNPVCLNSTITFFAAECGSFADCNYDNDLSNDQERIVSNCGTNPDGTQTTSLAANTENGAYSIAEPEFSCYYNNTGTFRVRLYLQDTANDDDFTVYNTDTILITVIDGISGSTCNILDTQITAPSDQEADEEESEAAQQADDAIEDTWGVLFGTSLSMRLLAAMGIIIAIMVSIAGATKGAAIPTIVGGVIGFIMVTFLGLVPPWIFLLGLVSMVLLLIMVKFILPSPGGGGG